MYPHIHVCTHPQSLTHFNYVYCPFHQIRQQLCSVSHYIVPYDLLSHCKGCHNYNSHTKWFQIGCLFTIGPIRSPHLLILETLIFATILPVEEGRSWLTPLPLLEQGWLLHAIIQCIQWPLPAEREEKEAKSIYHSPTHKERLQLTNQWIKFSWFSKIKGTTVTKMICMVI